MLPATPARQRHPLLLPACTAVALAALMQVLLRLVPAYDPYGWLVWGRQTLGWGLDPAGAPSWKPLPWLLSTPLSLAGGETPILWLILVSASGLVTLWLAYRLASRFGGPVAGVVAVLAVLLSRSWVVYALTGNSEALVAALALGAVECHLAGRQRWALALCGLVALARPESGLILAGYVLWLWRRAPEARRLAVLVVLALPLLWFLPPYLATGHRFGARDPVFHTGLAHPTALTVINAGATIVIWPVAVLGVLGLALAVHGTGRYRALALALASCVAAWTFAAVLMTLAGFPAVQRFLLPAAVFGCVLAGAGVGLAAPLLRRRLRRGGRWALLLAAMPLIVIVAFYGRFRVDDAVQELKAERAHATDVRDISSALARAGGASRLRGCGAVSAELGFQTALAWDFEVPVAAVQIMPRLALKGHQPLILFTANPAVVRGAGRRLLAHSGRWWLVVVRPQRSCLPSRLPSHVLREALRPGKIAAG